MRHRHEIVGREHELAQLRELFEADGPACLVLEGEAGIGKTTLWRRGLDEAPPGWTTLVAQPTESEAALPFAALGDLLEPLLGAEETELAEVDREVLAAALRRARPTEPASRLAVSRAVVALLRRAAERNPLLIAIDDTQWLDAPTGEVLEFAFRRLSEPSVRVLVARRSDGEQPLPLGLDRPPAPRELTHLRMGPLALDDVGRIMGEQLGLHLSRPRVVEVHRACGGNPFYALEIGRALLDAGPLADGDPLPVPVRGALLRRRLAALSDEGRLAALLAAASVHPTATLVEQAAGDLGGITEAVDAGLLEVEGDRVRFTHPLLATATYSAAPPWERREAHARLARAATTDRLEHAHHLARSTTDADDGVACELADAAVEAAARGAPETAASLLERAAELTPAEHDGERRRRLVDASQHHLASGDPARARRLLEEVVATLPPGPERADLLWQLADVADHAGDRVRIGRQALREAEGDPAVGARVHMILSTHLSVTGERARADEHSRAAASLAAEAGDDRLVALAVGGLSYRLALQAQPYPRADLERAIELEAGLPEDAFPAFQRPSFQLGLILLYTDVPDEARPLLRAELERLERAGNESWQIGVLFRLADLELRAGNWLEASRLARRSASIAMHGGISQEQTVALMVHGLVQAHLGHLDDAVAAAGSALALAEAEEDRIYAIRAMAVLGFAELSRGDAAAALVHLSPGSAELRRFDFGELSISQVVQNEIEALVALGRLEEAEVTIEFVEAKGEATQRSWHAAIGARGRALVASARGDAGEALRQIELALAAHERLPQPFELGRTLLAQGTIERRAKRRGDARAALTRALEIFDQLGAPLWAEKAAQELARIPGRAPDDGALSETERQVADLVASGLSNKEVAAKLFVTVRTVEGNLTRIYSKLGVRSRAQLAARVAQERAP
jgi:DNA-binding CsgD family transcriptional regulator